MTTFVCTSDDRHCCYRKKAEESALPPVRSEPMLADLCAWIRHRRNELADEINAPHTSDSMRSHIHGMLAGLREVREWIDERDTANARLEAERRSEADER